MAEFNEDEINIFMKFLSEWGVKNQFKFIYSKNDDNEIDFFNVNCKTRSIFVGKLNVNEEME